MALAIVAIRCATGERMCHASIMAGHSTSSLATKLSIKPGQVVALLNAPSGVAIELPPGVILRTDARKRETSLSRSSSSNVDLSVV